MCVQIDCLFLMPGFEYGSDFEIKISGVGDNADIRRKRGLFVSHCETGCSGGEGAWRKNEKSEETSSLFQLSYLDSNQE